MLSPVHLACMLGNLDILRKLMFKYRADFSLKTGQGVTPLHCASFSFNGIVSIFFMEDCHVEFDPNVRDINEATPLHYAVMNIEENNIQGLLSLKSDITALDSEGNSMLHVALSRYIKDQENFNVYKEVIKSML